jgi:NAD-dependent SIR2 family protein deacetylase
LPDFRLSYDAFIRSIKQNRDVEHAVLLGAGASINSGIQSAADCIWEWKKDIFLSKNPHLAYQYKNIKSDTVRKAIQLWLDNEGSYPELDAEEEYSYYAEKGHPIDGDRKKYFQRLSEGKEPSLGYHLLCLMAKKGILRSVWTTNFDSLILNAAYKHNLFPIEVTLESEERLYRTASSSELLCIALHGDYKYGPMKNTSCELDNQNDVFINSLKNELRTRNLIVLGYSGRDKSLMKALVEAYSERGAGRLYWCGYGETIPETVVSLITAACKNCREAFFVPTDGFDKTLFNLSIACFEESEEYLKKVKEIQISFAPSGYTCTPFSIEAGEIHKIIKSNLFPFSIPKECFQFEMEFDQGDKPWRLCNELSSKYEISAVPFRGMIYAFGTKDILSRLFRTKIKSDIVRTPIGRRSLLDITPLKDLVLKTITKAISSNAGLSSNFKNRIWGKSSPLKITAYSNTYIVHKGIELSLYFDEKYNYLAISPSFILESKDDLDKEIIKEISRIFHQNIYGQKPNLNFDKYISEWKTKIFKDSTRFKFEYPIGSGTGFYFVQSAVNACIAITQAQNKSRGMTFPKDFNQKRIIHKGVEYYDPQLTFFNPKNGKPIHDFHPMRGLVKNQPYDYFLNDSFFSNPCVDLNVICPADKGSAFYTFLNSLNQEIQAKHNPDYLISYPGFFSIYGIPINIPTTDEKSWKDCQIPRNKSDSVEIANHLSMEITCKIEELNRVNNKAVIVIFIPEEWEYFTSYNDGLEHFDLHDYIKAFSVQRNISTQLIREKTIKSVLSCQIRWWLSLAFYVKSLRTPWILTNLDKETAFAGLGYSIKHGEAKKNIVLGCSHIYNAEGQGLKYKLSKIHDFELDRKDNPFLSEHEAFQLGINIRELFYQSVGELPKRVVIHKKTRFTKEEILGLTQSLNHSGIENVDLIEITYENNARFISTLFRGNKFEADDFPVTRGSCFVTENNVAYLFTHGIALSVRNPNFRYFKGGASLPIPLKIRKHYGNSNISTVATEIMGLSKMNWNSFDLYTKLPCTIESSVEIAKIGWLLSHYAGRTYDYRNFM